MSRTDMHRPALVKEHDPCLRRYIRVHHDHWDEQRHPCEHVPACVPGKWEQHPTHTVRRTVACTADQQGGQCHRWIINGGNPYCGCRMCTGHWGRRLTRRRGRHDEQRLCRALAKDRAVGEDLPEQIPVKQMWASAGRRGRREPTE